MEKQTSTMNHSNSVCSVTSCSQTACYGCYVEWVHGTSTWFIENKIIFFKSIQNGEESMFNVRLCHSHYSQVPFISQCGLCGNRSVHVDDTLQKVNVREYQLILKKDNIPVKIKSGILICKPCELYIKFRSDKTIPITCELQTYIAATIKRICLNIRSKTKELELIQLAKNGIKLEKKKEDNQLLMVTIVPMILSSFKTADDSVPSQIVSAPYAIRTVLSANSTVASVMESLIATLTTMILKEAAITQPTVELSVALTKKIKYAKLSVVTKNSTALTSNQKRQLTFLDENYPVPRTKKPKISVVEPTTPVDKPMISDHKPLHDTSLTLEQSRTTPYPPNMLAPNKRKKTLKPKKRTGLPRAQLLQNTLDSMPILPPTEFPELSRQQAGPTTLLPTTDALRQLLKNPSISVGKPTIAGHKLLNDKSLVFSQGLGPSFNLKSTVLEKNEKSLESVLLIKEPTQLQTNQSYQNTLNSRSMSSRTEFPELNSKQIGPTTLLSTISDVIQLFESLRMPFPNNTDFIKLLLNLETCRSRGDLTLENNETTHRQQTSNTATTSPHIIRSREHKECQIKSRTDMNDNNLTKIYHV